jgi:hypothetical protein
MILPFQLLLKDLQIQLRMGGVSGPAKAAKQGLFSY